MAEDFLKLPDAERREALGVATSESGRPAHLLEKDVWVVWCLRAVFESSAGKHLVFKGGTSLSKVYGAIDRFSEDIDLTYDIRELVPEAAKGKSDNPVPESRSQKERWVKQAAEKLRELVQVVALEIVARLKAEGLKAQVAVTGEKLLLTYEPLEIGTGYVSNTVTLEFGARSTGEPSVVRDVVCDASEHLEALEFPTAQPRTMKAERTFWEKATAAHVYCSQKSAPADRFARHWHDLVRLDDEGIADNALADDEIASAVAEHKNWFFAAKDSTGATIDYQKAVSGALILVPKGEAREALKKDYQQMIDDGLLLDDNPMTFDESMVRCADLEKRANQRGNRAQIQLVKK